MKILDTIIIAALLIAAIVLIVTNSNKKLTTEEQLYQSVGKEVIVNGDTLTVKRYIFTRKDMFVLSNGEKVNAALFQDSVINN